MIYIDPPYNTGNDSFVYPDDYAERLTDYNKRASVTTGEGYLNKRDLWRKNTRENGHFHSVWLGMMYPRLYLARNLLRRDGVFFISIDDNEVANLKLLLDEIFGEENFEGHIHWRRRHNQPNDKTKMIALVGEHILAYTRDKDAYKKSGVGKVGLTGSFSNPDNDPRGEWASKPWKVGSDQSGSRYTIVSPTGKTLAEEWMGEKNTFDDLVKDHRIVWPKNGDGLPRKKYFRFEREEEGQCATNWWSHEEFGHNQAANDEMTELFGIKNVFSNPKPKRLIRGLLQIANVEGNGIVLDFFAGSGATAQAVLELNAEDFGTRKFICVQMPERLEEKSEAYKAGYRTIADICKARIKKVIENMQQARLTELELNGHQHPLGFQAFRLAPSNFKQWRGEVTGEEVLQQLEAFIHSEKEGSEGEKMLCELLLKWGYPLTVKVEATELNGQPVYVVEDGKLLVFFDDYNPAIKAYIHQRLPKEVVCLDRVFKNDDEILTNFQLGLREAGIELTIV
ncbi:MAG: site-specific DNA-methyltransferase, partial [candidate division KSB1 bacterium]